MEFTATRISVEVRTEREPRTILVVHAHENDYQKPSTVAVLTNRNLCNTEENKKRSQVK